MTGKRRAQGLPTLLAALTFCIGVMISSATEATLETIQTFVLLVGVSDRLIQRRREVLRYDSEWRRQGRGRGLPGQRGRYGVPGTPHIHV
jgi:hypothetical protein